MHTPLWPLFHSWRLLDNSSSAQRQRPQWEDLGDPGWAATGGQVVGCGFYRGFVSVSFFWGILMEHFTFGKNILLLKNFWKNKLRRLTALIGERWIKSWEGQWRSSQSALRKVTQLLPGICLLGQHSPNPLFYRFYPLFFLFTLQLSLCSSSFIILLAVSCLITITQKWFKTWCLLSKQLYIFCFKINHGSVEEFLYMVYYGTEKCSRGFPILLYITFCFFQTGFYYAVQAGLEIAL